MRPRTSTIVAMTRADEPSGRRTWPRVLLALATTCAMIRSTLFCDRPPTVSALAPAAGGGCAPAIGPIR